jgi:hypothetical protein
MARMQRASSNTRHVGVWGVGPSEALSDGDPTPRKGTSGIRRVAAEGRRECIDLPLYCVDRSPLQSARKCRTQASGSLG